MPIPLEIIPMRFINYDYNLQIIHWFMPIGKKFSTNVVKQICAIIQK